MLLHHVYILKCTFYIVISLQYLFPFQNRFRSSTQNFDIFVQNRFKNELYTYNIIILMNDQFKGGEGYIDIPKRRSS